MYKHFFFLFLLLLPSVAGVAVSPSKLVFDDLVVGQVRQGYFFVVANSNQTYYLTSSCPQARLPNQVNVNGREKVEFTVLIKEDKASAFDCSILVEEAKQTNKLVISNAASVRLILNTTTKKQPKLRISLLEVLGTEADQQIPIKLGLQNKGNVKIEPTLVFGLNNNKIRKSISSVRAGEQFQQLVTLEPLPKGQYNGTLSIVDGTLTLAQKNFTLSVAGIEESIGKVVITNVSITPGKTTKIKIAISNKADVALAVKPHVEFWYKDSLIKTVEGNQTFIQNTGELYVYEKLKRGTYTAVVSVQYNKKTTKTHEHTFMVGRNLNPTGWMVKKVGKENLLFIGLMILLVLIMVGKKYIKKCLQRFRSLFVLDKNSMSEASP
ncbi:hypothetical protein CL622_01300 [archaeon]|nr:hypothetical protein [archaeon]|tara:strand:+ start:943 stop:2082 length:1140 start_codon:yes stop_codon:yes gene_type:complete